jgi:hypothetical protein
MPEYLYRCACGQQRTARHGMMESVTVVCACGKAMKKAITAPRVNWNGNPPSGAQLSPQVQALIDTADERRDRYAAKLEQRKARAEHDASDSL